MRHFFPILLLVVLSACGKEGIEVQTAQSETRDIFARVTESGSIQPTIEVPVAPDVSGEIVDLRIKEGDRVSKGDLLLTIRPDDLQAQLEQASASVNQAQAGYQQAKANLAQAKATLLQDSVSLVRTEQLFKDEVVSQLDLENAQLRYKVSRSQLEAAAYSVNASYYQLQSAQATRKQARQSLDRTNIYASMDGTVTLLTAELGQRVVGTSMMAGTEILKVADLSRMEVTVEINENDIVNVNLGDSARVEVDAYPGKIFYGQVSEIAYSATTAALGSTDQVTNFQVKVSIDPSSYSSLSGGDVAGIPRTSPFRPGMTALVEVYTREASGVVAVPIQAVTLRGRQDGDETSGQEVVFVVENGVLSQKAVSTGISDDSFLQILSGLEDGQEVVTGPYTLLSRSLKEGMEVTTTTEEQ